jgi:ankyrin repeat protein
VDQIDYQGRTALHVACYMGHNGIIDQLLDYGSRLDRTTHKGLTPKDYFKLGEMQESLRRNPRMEATLTVSEQEEKTAQQQYIED